MSTSLISVMHALAAGFLHGIKLNETFGDG
jgi:hypothetical protein